MANLNSSLKLTSLLAVCILLAHPANTAAAALHLSRRWQDQCTSFQLPSELPEGIQATLTNATYYPAGALFNETSAYANLSSTSFKAFCRLQVQIETYPGNSDAKSEIWLPDDWNGRFLGVGNGASGGGFAWSDLGYTCVNNGFAGHSTNTGHTSNSSYAGWALNNPGAVVDVGYRAMHQGVVVSKAAISSYYSTSTFNSYYSACSLGGRQAWQEIQRYPLDFDAVLAGSPGLDDVRQSGSALYVNQKLLPVNGSTWFTENDWAVLHDEVLKQCDGLDGLEDGIVSDPSACKGVFKVQNIACKPGKSDKCLTYEQIKALYYVYNPWVDTNDTYVYAGSALGSELGLPAQFPASGGEYTQDGEFFRYLVQNDSSWRVEDISFASVQSGVNGLAYSNSATNPNITAFVARGGKVIQYVGWQDYYISPYGSIDWYNTVDLWMSTHTNYETSDYFRLFIVPGMGHCSGGPGAYALGQGPYSSTPPPSNDPEYNMLWAAIAWYEQGRAPTSFVGTKYNQDNYTQGIDFQRPICQWPLTTRYKGRGDKNQAGSFYCSI